MNSLSDLVTLLGRKIEEARGLRLADLQFWHRGEALLALVALVAIAIAALVIRTALRNRSHPPGIVLPALLSGVPRATGAWLVHVPLALFLVGVPLFMLALADPFTALVSSEASFPGRRIGIMLDASVSMRSPFTAATLNSRSETEAAFFTNVAAAERFLRLRINGKYRDLVGLVQFGNQAYVIMPFTSDYDNVLLSMSLIGDPEEFGRFPSQGTVITRAIEETVGLFRAFKFLDASGNMMIIFSDGEDSAVQLGEKNLDDVIASAIEAEIPVYLVRTSYGESEERVVQDAAWSRAVQRTGGKMYQVNDEEDLIEAIEDLDQLATGSISFRQYTNQEPRFAVFLLAAAGLWTTAALLKLGAPLFQKLS